MTVDSFLKYTNIHLEIVYTQIIASTLLSRQSKSVYMLHVHASREGSKGCMLQYL